MNHVKGLGFFFLHGQEFANGVSPNQNSSSLNFVANKFLVVLHGY